MPLIDAGYNVQCMESQTVKVGNNLSFQTSGKYLDLPCTVLAKTLPGVDNRQFTFVKRFHFADLEHEDIIMGIRSLDDLGLLDRIAEIYRAGRHDLQQDLDTTSQADTVIDLDPDLSIGNGDELDATLPEEMMFAQNQWQDATIADDAPESLRRRLLALNEKWAENFSELPPEGADMPPFPIFTEGMPQGRPPYRQSEAVQIECDRQVEAYLEKGIIARAPVTGWRWPPTSPVLAMKSDGSWRFCIDVSPTNAVTVPYDGPIPNAQECVDMLAGKKFYAVLDLTSGYHQARIRDEDQLKTAFRTRQGVFFFKRAPFGLTNLPAWWSEQMRSIFASEIGRSCVVYLDDFCVFGDTEEEFLANLDRIHAIAAKHRLRWKASKCVFGTQRLDHYLGYMVDANGKSLSPGRKEGIQRLQPPRNVSQLRTFLGLTNYFHDFIDHYAELAKPLTSICSVSKTGKSNFTWGEEQQRAFEVLKQKVLEAPSLAFPRHDRPLVLRTDASLCGVGGMLCQIDDDGAEKAIAFVSKAFNETEQKWSTYEQECFGMVYSVLKLRRYLFGRRFTIETDHRNLQWLDKAESPKVIRWRLSLAQYDFDVVHIPGITNVVADALSRLLPEPISAKPDRPSWLRQMEMALHNDDMESPLPDAMRLLVKRYDDTESPVTHMPLPAMVTDWFTECHNNVVGHHGVDITMKLLTRNGYDWPYKRQHVERLVKSCAVCQKNRQPPRPLDLATGTVAAEQPFQVVSMDFVGPLPPDNNGNQYILVFVDQFSRYIELFASPDCSALSTVRALLSVFGRYGAPDWIRSDNGPHFTADVVKHFLEATRARVKFTTPYRHEANGTVERVNLEVMRHLRALVYDRDVKESWSSFIPVIQRIINTTRHSTTRHTPSELVYGTFVDPDRGILTTPPTVMPVGFTHEDYFRELIRAQAAVTAAAQRYQTDVTAANKARGHTVSSKYSIGDLVLCDRTGRHTDKLSMTKGPYIVRAEVKPDTYTIEHPANGRILEEVHSAMLSPFVFDRSAHPDADSQEQLAEAVARLDDDDVYYVDSILGHMYGHRNRQKELIPEPLSFAQKSRVVRQRQSWFLVRWQGFPDPKYDTWEPYRNLADNDALQAYLVAHPELDLIEPA